MKHLTLPMPEKGDKVVFKDHPETIGEVTDVSDASMRLEQYERHCVGMWRAEVTVNTTKLSIELWWNGKHWMAE